MYILQICSMWMSASVLTYNKNRSILSMQKCNLLNKKCFLHRQMYLCIIICKGCTIFIYGCFILYLTVLYFLTFRKFLPLLPFKKMFLGFLNIFSHFGYFFRINFYMRFCWSTFKLLHSLANSTGLTFVCIAEPHS